MLEQMEVFNSYLFIIAVSVISPSPDPSPKGRGEPTHKYTLQ